MMVERLVGRSEKEEYFDGDMWTKTIHVCRPNAKPVESGGLASHITKICSTQT